MGLSASQARLLNLTNRMHQIEYNASRIEAMKLQMANESRRVYEDYLEALDKTKLQMKSMTTDGTNTFTDITSYKNFVDAGFAIVVHGVPNEPVVSYQKNEDGTGDYVMHEGDYVKKADWDTAHWGDLPAGATTYDKRETNPTGGSIICTTPEDLQAAIKKIFKDEEGNPLTIPLDNFSNEKFKTLLINLINSGSVTIVQSNGRNSDGKPTFPAIGSLAYAENETSVAINTSLQEVSDEVALRKAEAKYEADMKRIDMKDRRYDSDLAALDNERNAIKQEMETLKTVARDNVDRTFKIFS